MELLPSTEVIAGAAAMGAIIMAATMAYLAFLPAVSPAMGWWAIAMLANGAGLLLPGLWSDVATRPAMAAGQSALALSALLVYAGARRFIHGRFEPARFGTLLGLLVLAAALWASEGPSAPVIPAITALLFQRGKFDASMVEGTALALGFYALALLPVATTRVVVQGFYAMKDTKTPTRTAKAGEVWSDVERAAMKEAARERKAAPRPGSPEEREQGEREVRAKIAELPEPDRSMAERVHEIVSAAAPDCRE